MATRKKYINQTDELIDNLRGSLKDIGNALWRDKSAAQQVVTLDTTELAGGNVVEAIGIPNYISDVTDFAAYGITEPGWYVFSRIQARPGYAVTSETSVTGAAGYIAEVGASHVDLAVRFNVAAQSVKVSVDWGAYEDVFIFKATDLAVRNLDYRTTFYIYDIAPFATWTYGLTTDATFVGTAYYTEDNGVYTQAAVKAYAAVPANTYYTHAYALTTDTAFVEGKVYYTLENSVYSAATVTAGEAVTANTYYEDVYTLTTDTEFVGTAYYIPDGEGGYTQVAVKAGETVSAYYLAGTAYVMTTDATFTEGKTYYTATETEVEGETVVSYTEATVTTGEAVTANTYYEQTTVYTQTDDPVFLENVTYYTKSGAEYAEATVTPGDAIPAFYKHTKLTFSGMARNITYQFNEIVDCPQEYILPEIEDDGHGTWYEIRLRHAGSYSSTLTVPEGVKVATEHTQAETKGFNMVDLHYQSVAGGKIWRFMNTHSSIPTT